MIKFKVAFDVKGTLEGPKQDIVRAMLDEFLKHEDVEVYVWSSLKSYAYDYVRDHDVKAYAIEKRMTREVEGEDLMDLAIEDDRMQTYLATRNFLFVGDLPDNEGQARNIARAYVVKFIHDRTFNFPKKVQNG